MTVDEILKMVLSAVVSLTVAGGLAFLWRKLREPWELIKILRNTGLKHFLPNDRFNRLDIFDNAFKAGQPGDEILIVGRTLRWLVEHQRDLFIEGLERGMDCKVLILNPQKVRNQTIGLAPLQLKDPKTVIDDLNKSLKMFHAICEEAKQRKLKGSFEVRVSDYVIINSLTSVSQVRKAPQKSLRRLILDFSFSTSRVDKYQQYYECDPSKEDHFANKMYRFYMGSFSQSQPYLKYDDLVMHSHASLLHEEIDQDINRIADRYDEGEELRENQSRRLLPAISRVLATVREGQPASPPLSVQFELNNECNTRCRHCKRHAWPSAELLTTAQVKEILEQLADQGVKTVTFSGGEPTLRPDFPEILHFASNCGIRAGVLTNGLSINRSLAGELAQTASWVRISVDAATEPTYFRVRGVKDGLAQVVESIQNLDTARRSTRCGCRIGVCYTLQSANIAEAGKMIEFVKSLGLGTHEKILTFKFVHGRNGILCTGQQLADFRREILDRSDPELDRWTNLPYLRKFLTGYSNEKDIASGQPLMSFYRDKQPRCFAPYLFSMIDAFGDVYPCCFMYYDNESFDRFREKRDGYRMGQLKQMKFNQVWQGVTYERFRNDLKTIDVNAFPECRECTRHYLHNAFLSDITKSYDHYKDEFGSEAGDAYKQVLLQNPGGEVWL